jgi:hypothetical protein
MRLLSILDWISEHPIRFTVYLLLPVSIFSVLVAPMLFCHCGGGALETLINRPVFRDAAEKMGVRYTVGATRLCCLRDGWFWGIDVDSVDIELTQQPLLIHVDQSKVAPLRGISINELLIGVPASPDLIRADHMQTDLFLKRIETQQVQILLGNTLADSYVRTANVTLSGLSPPRGSDRALTVGNIETDGVDIFLQRGSNGEWNSDRGHSLRQVAENLVIRPVFSLDALYGIFRRLRRILLLILIGLALLLVVLKFLLVRNLQAGRGPTLTVALAVLVPIACYGILFESLSLVRFLLVSLLVVLGIAWLLQRTVYRTGREWHQRWEPFALDILAVFALLPVLIAYGFLPTNPSILRTVRVAETRVNRLSASLRDSKIGPGLLADLKLPEITARDLSLDLDPISAKVTNVNLGRAALHGIADSDLATALRQYEWLPRTWTGSQQILICGNFRDLASAIKGVQRECTPQPQGAQLVFDVVAGLKLVPAAVRYSIRSRVQSSLLDANLEMDGNERSLKVGSLRSSPTSAIRIGGGSGTISFNPLKLNLRLSKLGFRDQVRLQTLDTSLSLPFSNPGNLHLDMAAEGFGVEAIHRRVTLKDATIRLDQSRASAGHALSLATQLHSIELSSLRRNQSAPWLYVELPVVRFEMIGRTPPGMIPTSLDGQGKLLLARTPIGEKEALWTGNSARFSLDLIHGKFNLPQQDLSIRQSLFPQAPQALDMRLSATARIRSLMSPFDARSEAHIRIPEFIADVLTFRAELNELALDTSAFFHNSNVELGARYASGLSYFSLPSIPRWNRLEQISRLDMHFDGTASALPPYEIVSRDIVSLFRQCGSWSTNASKPLAFQFDGTWPAKPNVPIVRLTGGSSGIAVRDADLKLNKLSFPALRLGDLDVQTEIVGIHTSTGEGNLNAVAAVHASNHEADADVSIPMRRGKDLAFRLRIRSGELKFALVRNLSLAPLYSEIRPFLRGMPFNLDAVSLDGNIERLQAAARFRGTQLTGFDVDTLPATGLIASVDLSKLSAPSSAGVLEQLHLYSGAGTSANPGLHLKIESDSSALGSAPTELSVEAGRVGLGATDNQNRAYHVGLSLNSKIRLNSLRRDTDDIADKLQPALTGLASHAGKFLQLLENETPSASSGIRNVFWDVNLHNRSGDQPVFSLSAESATLAALLDLRHLGWQWGDASASDVRATIDLQTDFLNHANELVVDGYMPIDATFRPAGRRETHLKTHLPVLILLANQLRGPGAASASLWDTEYYDHFWRDYRPLHTPDRSSLLNAKTINVGPLSIQQFRIPSAPITLAVGYGPALELYAPISAQVMFGRANGGLESKLLWLHSALKDATSLANLDSRLNLSLRALQASAFGLNSGVTRLPLLEDQLDGEIRVTTDQLTLGQPFFGRSNLRTLVLDNLDRIDIDARLWSTPDREGRGVVHAISRAQLKAVNEFLKEFARDLQLQAPPRSLTYGLLSFDLEASHGLIQARSPLVQLRDAHLFSTDQLALQGDFRAHLGSAEEPFSLRSLVESADRMLAVDGASFPRHASRLGNTKFSIRRNR